MEDNTNAEEMLSELRSKIKTDQLLSVILFTFFGNLKTYTRNGSGSGMTRLRWRARTRARWSAMTSRRFRTYPATISALNLRTSRRYRSSLNPLFWHRVLWAPTARLPRQRSPNFWTLI